MGYFSNDAFKATFIVMIKTNNDKNENNSFNYNDLEEKLKQTKYRNHINHNNNIIYLHVIL